MFCFGFLFAMGFFPNAVVGPWGVLVMYLKSYQGFNKKKKPLPPVQYPSTGTGTTVRLVGHCYLRKEIRALQGDTSTRGIFPSRQVLLVAVLGVIFRKVNRC